MKRKLFKSMCLAMLLAAFAGCGTEKNSVLPQMDLPKAEALPKQRRPMSRNMQRL